jgi:hypothetical protein
MGMVLASEALAPVVAASGEAVRHDTGKDEDHGDESGQVGDVLLRPEAGMVVMRCR